MDEDDGLAVEGERIHVNDLDNGNYGISITW